MTKHGTARRFLSPRRILLGVLGLLGGLVVAILHGGLGAIGHEIVQKSQIIHEIEEWITKELHLDQRAAMGPEELERLCLKRAMNVMPTEGLPGFIERRGNCLKKVGDFNAL